jgi:hypothetical protein
LVDLDVVAVCRWHFGRGQARWELAVGCRVLTAIGSEPSESMRDTSAKAAATSSRTRVSVDAPTRIALRA